MPLCIAPGRPTHTHARTLTGVVVPGVSASQHRAPRGKGRALFPQQSRIVCTHTASCITAINHVGEITISTRQLQRAAERSN